MTARGRLHEGGQADTATASARGGGGPAATAVHDIGGGAAIVDLHHLGRPTIIGVGVLDLPDGGVALVDPGPEARLSALRAGLAKLGRALQDVRAVLLTHIHLDHATAAGAIVRESPGAIVHVHAIGAPHMADPTRLLASAERIYGDAMATLWGDFVAVPRASLRVVDDGDEIAPGGRRLRVAYAPGHAKHHVAYYEAATGTAWVGDVGGVRIHGGPALPVAPPPDIDIAAWKGSIERVLAWGPRRMVVTHFGAYGDVAAHFAELRAEMDRWAAWVRDSLEDEAFANDRERARAFSEWITERVAATKSGEHVELYAAASRFADSWWGLARYWRKRVGG